MRRLTTLATLVVVVLGACSGSSEPTAIYTGHGCEYDGPLEFALNSTVTFTFTNESDTTEVGFSVRKLPEGVTSEEILGQGIFTFVKHDADTIRFPPNAIGEPGDLSVPFLTPGQWGVVCFDQSGGEHDGYGLDYVTMITVNE